MSVKKKNSGKLTKPKIKMEPYPNINLEYAHHVNFAINPNEAILSFMQIVPSVTDNTSYDAQAKCVRRIVFSRENFEDFVNDLNELWKNVKQAKEKTEDEK